MKLRKILTGLIGGVAMLALAGAASAAPNCTESVNVYGASAEFLFWNAASPAYLSTYCGSGATISSYMMSDGKNGIVVAENCKTAGNTFCIRVSAKASFDGICALNNNYDSPSTPNCTYGQCTDNHQRKMVDESTCSGTSCSGTKCVTVNGGASDVEGRSFNQQSHGHLLGPLGGSSTDRVFAGLDSSKLTDCKSVIVPFAFFVNKSVTKGGATIDNLSRMQAVQIFSGQAVYWTDFGPDYTSLPIVACLRHAGSGTHATLDLAVMNSKWGGNLLTNENSDITGNSGTVTYFNDGSSDLMKCVNGVSGTSWTGAGAVGYSDADQCLATYSNSVQVKYNGVEATRTNIANGSYDFWTNENLYYNPSDPMASVIADMCLQTRSFIPAVGPVCGSGHIDETQYWATQDEMVFQKCKDSDYPSYNPGGLGCQ